MDSIPAKDLETIRSLAGRYREHAESPRNTELRKKWLLHNTMKGELPMVTVELGTFSGEVIPPMMTCESDAARGIEYWLRHHLCSVELFRDDTPLRNYYPVSAHAWFKPFDIDIKVERAENSLGHQFVPQIRDLKEDFHKIKKSPFGVGTGHIQKEIDRIDEILGGIIPAKKAGFSLYAVPTQAIVHVMCMEDMFTSMYDYPDLFKQMINSYADDCCEYFDLMEREGILLPTTDGGGVAQGTYNFTDELPSEGEGLKVNQVWGFADSQETVGVSAEMFEEFMFPAYKKIVDRYGLLSYGCCEAVDFIWDRCLSKFANLRKLSISAWCDERFIGERLAGTKVIYHRKPNPNFIGVGTTLDEDAFRKHVRTTLEAARGCKVEFTTRDVYTINHDIPKVRRYVELTREEIEKHYR